MIWKIILITLGSVLFNHLGLAEELTFRTKKNVVINCVKCCTFWCTFLYMILNETGFITAITIALILSYISLWIEVLLSILNKKYNEIAGKIYSDEDTKMESVENEST